MTQRKISYWLMFLLKILPLLLIILVAIYCHRHEVFTSNASYTYVIGTNNDLEVETTVTATNYMQSIFYNTFSVFNDTFKFRNIFGIEGFYYWFCNNVFNQNVPIAFETIFNILFYEFFVELITLLYSFVVFIVKFAKRFLGGFYEKTNL